MGRVRLALTTCCPTLPPALMGDTDEYDRAKATAITFVRGGRDLQTALLKDFALDLVLVITGHDARDAQLRLDTIAAVKRLAGVRDHPEQPPGRGAEGGEPPMAADIAAGVAGNRGRAAAAAGSGSKTEPIPVSSDHEDSDDAASAPDDARAEVAAHDGQLDVHAPEVAQLLRDVARDARQARDMARDTHTLVHTLLRIHQATAPSHNASEDVSMADSEDEGPPSTREIAPETAAEMVDRLAAEGIELSIVEGTENLVESAKMSRFKLAVNTVEHLLICRRCSSALGMAFTTHLSKLHDVDGNGE
ncbi:hypothetical protein K525DRAFT_246088, partial [Schizophyllum commune Loenen D]